MLSLLLGAGPADVETVLISGDIVKAEGKLIGPVVDQARDLMLKDGLHHGEFTDYFSKDRVELNESTQLSFAPWGYRVFVK